MDLEEAVHIAVERTGHRRYAELLDPSHPDYEPGYERVVRAIAEGRSAPPAMASPPTGPSLLQKAARFAIAAVQHVSARTPRATSELAAQRLSVCRQCDKLRGSACQLCGCNMPLKVTWVEQTCPAGKW